MWRLSWGDKSWTAADLTGAHLTLIVLAVGEDTWETSPSAGPVRLMANLAAFVAIDEGRNLQTVLAELQRSSAVDLLAALTVETG